MLIIALFAYNFLSDLIRARIRDNVVVHKVKSEVRVDTVYIEKRDLVKNRDYQTACNNRAGGQLPPSNQANEEYLQPVIVSGSRK